MEHQQPGEGRAPRTTQNLLAAGWALTCILVLVSRLQAPPGPGATRTSGWSVVAMAVLIEVAILFLPWSRWKRTAPLWMIPVVFAVVGMDWQLGRQDPFLYALPFLAVFMLIGLTQRPGTALRLAPVLVVFYLLPLLIHVTDQGWLGAMSAILVVPLCVVGGELVARTVARMRRTEAELVASEERYMLAFESAPVGMSLLSPDGTFLHVNGAFARMLGYEVDDLVGRTTLDITHPDDRDHISASADALKAGEIREAGLEKRVLRADGGEVWVKQLVSLVRDTDGEPLYLFGHSVDISEERSLRQQLAHAAEHDQLTGLPNRTVFMRHIERTLVRAATERSRVALLFLDVDRFKLINDGLGHDVGDQVLTNVALHITEALRPHDVVVRLGGDEFVVVCVVQSVEEALRIAERLETAVEHPLPPPRHDLYVTLSIGIAVSGEDDVDASLLVRQADTAMYRAKSEGQGRIAVYRSGEVLLSDRKLQTANDLRAGLERGEFELFYQPVVELATGQLLCLKAEVRWHHPSEGLLPPSEFMAIAEESDLSIRLGRWALREVCRQGSEWAAERCRHGQGEDRLNLAVNVSIRQLVDPGFAGELADLLVEFQVLPDRLWLEITEEAVLGGGRLDRSTADRIRDLGVHIAIQGFGTQRSSLTYLKELPVELVKIDQSFVGHIEEGAIDEAMIEAMLALASSLGLLVVAEGVERRSQAALLASLGCVMAQGPLYGGALSALEIGTLPSDDLGAWKHAAPLQQV